MGHASSDEGRPAAPPLSADRSFTLGPAGSIDWTRRAPSQFSDELTPRENEVLVAYVRTPSWKLVAFQLGIHQQTVKNHVTHIRAKLGVLTLTEVYREIGWLVAPEPIPWTAA